MGDVIAWITAHFDWWILTVIELVWVLVAAVVVVLERRSAAATIAWLLALGFLPIVGLLVYRLIGPRRLARKRWRHRYGRGVVKAVTRSRERLQRGDSDEIQLARVAAGDTESPPLRAQHLECFLDGASCYSSLFEAVSAARQHVHLEFYIWEPDRIGLELRDLLIGRARAGVKVRMLVDGTGSARLGRKFLKPLLAAGVEFARFNPVQLRFIRTRRIDFRTHRKIVVCDGRIGFTGGMNITDVHSARLSSTPWRDTHLRVEGSAVWPLQRLFLEDWYFATEQVPSDDDKLLFPEPQGAQEHVAQIIGSGPDQDLPNMLHTFFTAITLADVRVWVTTPYFVPEESLVTALHTAVQRSVDVRLLLPHRGDSRIIDFAARSYLPELIAHGVKVYEYMPGFIHAKTFVIDDDLAIVGSANLDNRSMRLNFEVAALLYDRGMNHVLSEAFERDLAQSRSITLDDVTRLTWPTRLCQASARLLSPLL
jgi:cardiolipin synthase